MRSSDWSSDVCSSDLPVRQHGGWSDGAAGPSVEARSDFRNRHRKELTTCVAWVCLQVLASFASAGVPSRGATSKAISFAVRPPGFFGPHSSPMTKKGRTAGRERVCKYEYLRVVAMYLKKKQ